MADDRKDEAEDDRDEVDFRDLTRSALERMLSKALRRKKGERDEGAAKKADEEREDLADLSEEKKGKSNAPKVEKNDFHPDDVDESDDDEKDEDEKSEKKSGNPFAKKKSGNPFKKKKV